MKTDVTRHILVAGLLLCALVIVPGVVRAATITVTDTSGADADNGACSIVEAVQNANADNQSGSVDCAAGVGTDTIALSVDVDLDAAINNGGGEVVTATHLITQSLVVDGNGHTIENTLGASLRFFKSETPGVDITISDITFLNGNVTGVDGGALYFDSIDTVVLDNVTFNGNVGDNGGAVYVTSLTGNITITDSYFTENTAPNGHGGVFYLDDTDATVTDSYFYFNRPNTTLGGVFYLKNNGSNPTLDVDSSTFEDNTAGSGGVFYLDDSVTLDITNSTFETSNAIDDGGVIFSYQTSDGNPNNVNVNYVTSFNGFSGNSAAKFFYNCIDEGGCEGGAAFGPDTYIFENSILDGCDGVISDSVFTNILGAVSCGASLDVTNMGGLSDNGGPWKTFALSSGSNAINAGVAGTLGCPSTDGRGATRPYDGTCDIGAFEFASDVITLTQSAGTTNVAEGGSTDTFTLELDAYPGANVTITFTADSEVETSPASVTFLQADWPETKTITVSAVDDSDDEDDTHTGSVSFTVTSADVGYNGYSVTSLSVDVVDNDISGGSSGSSGNGGNNNPPPPPPPPPVEEPDPIDPPPPPIEEPDEELPPIDEPVDEEPIPEDTDDELVSPIDDENENHNEDNLDEGLPLDKDTISIQEFPGAIVGALAGLVADVPKDVADTVSFIGVALPTIAFAVTQPAVAANVLSIPLRLWNLIPIWLGLRRKKRPWGTVYDSVTKQPLDPVYLTLKDEKGKVVATTISDLDGRFGFLVPPGRYKLLARKDDYIFPSKKLAGKPGDELYNNLYFGAGIEISGTESLVINNIPMDSTSFNWNEFEKSTNKRLMKFYSKRDVFLARIAEVSFWGGFVFSVALLFIGPGMLNYVLFGIYAAVLALRLLGVKPKKPGYVTEKATGFPLSFGLIRIFSANLGTEVAHAIISPTGRYYALVPKGEYYVSIEKKVGEDEYREVYKSAPLKAAKGFIGENFNV